MNPRMTMMETPEDMKWLFDVHFKGRVPAGTHNGALLYGNEDCPERVDLFATPNPSIGDHYCRFLAEENGELKYSGIGIIGDGRNR